MYNIFKILEFVLQSDMLIHISKISTLYYFNKLQAMKPDFSVATLVQAVSQVMFTIK